MQENELLDKYGLNGEEVKAQIVSEKTQSMTSMQTKRMTLWNNLALYNNQQKNADKININLIYSNIRALMAFSFNTDLLVEMAPRHPSDIVSANIISKAAEFDKEEMNLPLINLKTKFNRFFYGVDIKMFDDWNTEKNSAIVTGVNPLQWYPDPMGSHCAEWFRFSGFEGKLTKYQMQSMGFAEIDSFRMKASQQYYDYNPYNKMGRDIEQDSNEDANSFYVYNHFTIVDGHKYMFTTNYDCDKIARIVSMKEIFGNLNDELWTFSLSYFNPEEFNPYGTNICDLSADKQIALSKLFNLAVIKATRNSLGNHRLYDKNTLGSIPDLANLSVDPKFIGVDLKPNQNLQNVIYEPAYQQVPQDNYDVSTQLQYQNRISTGIDPLTMGLSMPGEMTKAEAQQIQTNANMIIGLGNIIDTEGEKDFWKKRLHITQKNLKGDKLVRVTNSLGTNLIRVNKNVIKTKEPLDVKIVNKNDQDAEDRKQNTMIAALLPQLQQISPFGYKYALRKTFQLNGIDLDESQIFVPLSGEEEEARQQVLLLNNNIELPPVDDVMGEDHDAYIAIYKESLDTPAKAKAIQSRISAKIQKQKAIVQQQGQQGANPQTQANANANQSNNIIASNAMQQESPIVTSKNIK